MAETCDVCMGPLDKEGNCRKGADDCFEDGYARVSTERDRLKEQLVQRDATIRTQDELLGRARAVLVDVGKQLNDTLKVVGGGA